MSGDPYRLSATEARQKILAGELTSEELVSSCCRRFEETESNVKAWVVFDKKKALAAARQVDQKIAKREAPPGLLAGVPVGVKDVFNTADFPTCMGSPIWEGFTPGNDARVVFYMRQEDAVIPGKTTTAEFAVHAPSKTVNPHNPAYSPGTSSSGSAAAVAMGHVPLATGTQTAGSIIRPASYCGVFGYKPTFGVIPRTGILKTTDSLDTVGMFARSVDDLEMLFEVMRVHGRNFPMVHRYLENQELQTKRPQEPWKVLLVSDSLEVWQHADPYAKKALLEFANQLAGEGVLVETKPLPPDFNEAHRIHSVIYDKTLAYYFKEEYKKHTLISNIMYEIISRGQNITLDQYKQALEEQEQLSRKTDELFAEGYDAILALSTSGQAPKYGGDDKPDSALIWTLCGNPSINVPLFKSPARLPFGLQVVGRRYRDYRLFHLARMIEQKFLAAFDSERQKVLSS